MEKKNINLWKSRTGRSTLFFHQKSNIVFDCFPRSKSTLILSNIFSNATGKSTNEWSQVLRRKYIPSGEDIALSKKVICLRSPRERFRSFLISKIVNPHATSILPLFFLDNPKMVEFLCGNSAGIKFSKSINPLLNNVDNDELSSGLTRLINCSPIFAEVSNHKKIHTFNFLYYVFNEYLSFNVETILKRLFNIVDKNSLLDQHIMSQSFLSTFQLKEYDYVLSVDNLNSFSVFYKQKTGFEFTFGKKNTSQDNTQYLFSESEIGQESIEKLRLQTSKKITPTLSSIFSPKNTWEHFKMYEKDYAMMLSCVN